MAYSARAVENPNLIVGDGNVALGLDSESSIRSVSQELALGQW
jgi:hypothetical protein